MAAGVHGYLFGGACNENVATARATLRSNINYMVSYLNDIHIVLDNNHGVALIGEFLQYAQ